MPDPMAMLLDPKAALLRQIASRGDFRPGSITTTTGRCGNPNCRCHRPNEPGHGPNFRQTSKAQGKTVTESLPTMTAREKAEREIDRLLRLIFTERRKTGRLDLEAIEMAEEFGKRIYLEACQRG
ncbi:MAG: DUF6788 family protein, partial [Acidobacteriaceae bacterium]